MQLPVVFAAGALYGLVMRLAFGWFWFFDFPHAGKPSASGPMLVSFLCLVPIVIGALSVYLARASAPGYLHAVANFFLIEDIERGETNVGYFFLTERDCLIRCEGRCLRHVRRRYGRC